MNTISTSYDSIILNLNTAMDDLASQGSVFTKLLSEALNPA